MRALLSFAVALSMAALHPAAAQESSSARRQSSGVTSSQGAPLPGVSPTEKEAAAARARNEARERGWDDKMKRTMRSICSGAKGC